MRQPSNPATLRRLSSFKASNKVAACRQPLACKRGTVNAQMAWPPDEVVGEAEVRPFREVTTHGARREAIQMQRCQGLGVHVHSI